jgi:hypothetical protein
MTLHHYLPATYLANFSADTHFPRRSRTLAVGDKRSGHVFITAAANVAAVHDLYTLSTGKLDSQMVDEIWSDYEAGLADAIQQLIDRTLDAITWARILVPFVTCLFVRGPEFAIRFDTRMRQQGLLGLQPEPDSTNLARIMEVQRLLAPILTAKWLVLRVHGDGEVILNDLGFGGFVSPEASESGFSIPLNRDHVLMLIPQRDRIVATASGRTWMPSIAYADLRRNNHLQMNDALTQVAQRFVFGANEEIVRQHLIRSDSALPVPEFEELGFIGSHLMRVHEFTWYRLVSVLDKHPLSAESWSFELDFPAIASGWAPMPVLPVLGPYHPSAISRRKGLLRVTLYDPTNL